MDASVAGAGEPSWQGRVIGGKYRLVGLLGRGGMGTVYETERLGDGARFALKCIDRADAGDEVTASRFAREVRAANAIRSPHIVRVVDVGTDDGCPFLVMDRLEGEDLGARLRQKGRLDAREAVMIASQILRGLGEAHALGIIHRDLKPDNVFLVTLADGAAEHGTCVKILDFGMSKMQPLGATAPLALTLRGVAVGTPLYMSPEQAAAHADVDLRADLYSVGAILFECVTGRPPHVGETDDEVLTAIRTTPAAPVARLAPRLGAPLGEVIDRALSFDRSARFGSAERMRRALEAAATPREVGRPRPRVRMWAAALAALVLGVVMTVVTVLLVEGR